MEYYFPNGYKQFLLFFALIFMHTIVLWGQPSNPFDLSYRLSEEDLIPTDQVNDNPFDLSHKVAGLGVVQEELKAAEYQESSVIKEYERLARLKFWVFVFLLFYISIIMLLFRELIGRSLRAIFNNNIMGQLLREQRVIASVPFLLLNLFFLLNVSVFVWLVLGYYEIRFNLSWGVLLGYIFVSIFLFYLFRHIIIRLVGIFFPVSKEQRLYSFTITVFSGLIGLGLFVFNLGLAYLPESMFIFFLYFSLTFLLISYGFRTVKVIFQSIRLATQHIFHFLLYICSVEIAPLLFLVKYILIQVS